MTPKLQLRTDAPYITCRCGTSFNTDRDGGKAAKRHQKICRTHATTVKLDDAESSSHRASAVQPAFQTVQSPAIVPGPDEAPSLETDVQRAPKEPPTYAVGNEWENDGLPLDPEADGYERPPPVTIIQESTRSDGERYAMYATQDDTALEVCGKWDDHSFGERMAVREADEHERAAYARKIDMEMGMTLDPEPCRFDPATRTGTYALDPSWGECRRVLRLLMECKGMYTYEAVFEDGHTHAVTVGYDLRVLQNEFCREVRDFWREADFMHRFVPHRIEIVYNYLPTDTKGRK